VSQFEISIAFSFCKDRPATPVDASALNDGGFTQLDFDPRSG
jgi:hypothetical protein